VLWREHGAQAERLPGGLARLLKLLVEAQSRWASLEWLVKIWRGWLGGIGKGAEARPKDTGDLGRLLTWIQANGETARARRLAQWHDYFETLSQPAAQLAIARCLALAEAFAGASQQALGKYTEGVERFVSRVAPTYRYRYDAEFISRSQLEYHLGMLGTEILNRAYRARFLAASRKIIIVPPCLRAQPDDKCQAASTPFGAQCQACTPACRVHQITSLGLRHGVEVFIIPDELRVFGSGAGQASLGVVGVSCALTNWGGGWEAEALGIPAQGVLLDYVGCTYHWDRTGLPTDTNLRRLIETVGH
jgi:hypothetical protein